MTYNDRSSRIFLMTLLYNTFFACIFLILPEFTHINIYFVSSFFSILILVYSFKHTQRWMSVVNFFIVIWMIFVPLSCGEHPMMRSMTSQEILWVLLQNIMFSFGGLLACSFPILNKRNRVLVDNAEERIVLKPNTYIICVGLLIFSVSIAVMLFVINGIPIFAVNANDARNNLYSIPGSSLIHNMGIPINFLIFCDKEKRKRKLFIVLLVVYLITLLFTGARFTLIINFIMLATVMEMAIQKKLSMKKILMISLLILLAFYAIVSVRSGLEDKEYYFISTGLYKGDAKDLVVTEPLRYFGMPQRLMDFYINTNGTTTNGTLTFYPYIRFLVDKSQLVLNRSLYGYNAINVMSYLWCDFKWGMWFVIIILAFICQNIYMRFLHNPSNLYYTYAWSVVAFAIVLSFYCYTYSYSYWLLEFPIMIIIIKNINDNRSISRGK